LTPTAPASSSTASKLRRETYLGDTEYASKRT
jgi:hypothetical protein